MEKKRWRHSNARIVRAASLFFAVRGLMRTRLARGKRLNPSAWLRIETLKFVADARRPSMREVAEHFSITAPSATSLARGLLADGLVARVADSKDRRVQRLTLTGKGKRMLARIIARGTILVGELFAPLSASELAAFTKALERIKKAAEK